MQLDVMQRWSQASCSLSSCLVKQEYVWQHRFPIIGPIPEGTEACLDIFALKLLELAACTLQLGSHGIVLGLFLSMPAYIPECCSIVHCASSCAP